MAKVVSFSRLGEPEVLEIVERDVAAPREGEVRIDVKAIGLNRAESLFRRGIYIEQPDLPSGIGLEAAGIVKSVGSAVGGFAPGDRVAVIPPISMRRHPVHAQQINYPAEFLVALPAEQSFEEAAATWMAYLTAFGGLTGVGGLRPADTVVITAASSSVGLAAIQIVNALGGVPVAITRTHEKRAALLAAGAKHALASDQDDVAAGILAATGSGVPRIVFDAVGGRLLPQLLEATATEGVVISYGAQDPEPSRLPPAALLAKSLTLRGYLVHELVRDAARLSAAKAFILEHLSSGALRPTISRCFPLDQISAAFEFLETGSQFGKIVVTLD